MGSNQQQICQNMEIIFIDASDAVATASLT
jgi:hypothetical protein